MPNILSAIANSPLLFAAVKEVFEKQFTPSERDDLTLSNDKLGELARARLMGLQALKEAYKEIEMQKKVEVKEEALNPAR